MQRPLYNKEKKTILTLKSVISNTSLLSFQQFWYASKLCREAKRFCLRAVQPKISMVSASVLSESKSTYSLVRHFIASLMNEIYTQ